MIALCCYTGAYYGLVPSYLCCLFDKMQSTYSLRDYAECLLVGPRNKLTFGDMVFSKVAPFHWTSLPIDRYRSLNIALLQTET